MTEDELHALVGHRFPGGTRRIEHWESYLLTDCTTREQLPDGLVHPIALFHVPIQGAGTSIAELFELGRVAGAGSVGLDAYDWEYHRPLRVEVDYRVDGGVVEVERCETSSGTVFDRFVFSIELSDAHGPVARITNHWRLRRAGGRGAGGGRTPGEADTVVGEEIPPWTVDPVDAQRMKTMAAILRDPYEVHWDRQKVAGLGFGERTINQGPLNLSYIANALMAWQGPASIRRLTVSFGPPVLDGDRVEAGGVVTSTETVGDEERASCRVWLRRDGAEVVSGSAVVAVG